jgi:ABC-2 type transport system permease protein
MDAPATLPMLRFIPWLPYWAVLQTDLRQTVRGWVWRTWVLTSLLAAIGYLLYRLGVYREAGIVQHASTVTGDLLRWPLLGTVLLVVILAVSAMTAERGTLADSVLSRGISRRQYFMAKLHSRLFSVMCTFAALTAVVLTVSHFLLHEDLALGGSIMGVAALASLLVLVVTCGVTVGALVNTTVFGVSVVWLALYAAAFGLSLLPPGYPTPDRLLVKLPQVLRGIYDLQALTRMIGIALAASGIVALIGMLGFSRSDL